MYPRHPRLTCSSRSPFSPTPPPKNLLKSKICSGRGGGLAVYGHVRKKYFFTFPWKRGKYQQATYYILLKKVSYLGNSYPLSLNREELLADYHLKRYETEYPLLVMGVKQNSWCLVSFRFFKRYKTLL